MSWREVHNNLKTMDNQQIISIIKDLHSLNKANKEFLSAKLLPDSFNKILEESKELLRNKNSSQFSA